MQKGRLRVFSNQLPRAAEGETKAVQQRAEVKMCSSVLDGSLAETLFRSLCTGDFNKHL